MRATPNRVAAYLRDSGFRLARPGKREGFCVRWRDDGLLVIVTSDPPSAEAATQYRTALSRKWPVSQVGDYVAVHVR